MNTKAIKTSSDSGKATLYVFREPKVERTQLALYLNFEPGNEVVLDDIETLLDGENIKDTGIASKVIGNSKSVYKSILTFRYVVKNEEQRQAQYFQYQLPGVKHEVKVVTPDNEVLIVDYKEKGKEK